MIEHEQAASWDIAIREGEPLEYELTVTEDWTGTYIAQVRNGNALCALMTLTHNSYTGGVSTLTLALTKEESAKLSPGRYEWAARNTATKKIALHGRIVVTEEPIPIT